MLYLLVCIIFIICAWVFSTICWNFLGLFVFILLAMFFLGNSFFIFEVTIFHSMLIFCLNFMQSLLLAATKFIAHLTNQQVAHEISDLELLIVLPDIPTNDSVKV